MFLLRPPTEAETRRFMAERESAPLTYPELGASRGTTAPPGYLRNFALTRLGTGEETFHRAAEAVRRWAMYDMDWIRVLRPDTPIEPGRTVGLVIRHYGFWSMHAGRIVYVVDDREGPVRRFGLAYGTVADHAERGEERFTVEWREDDDVVHYELFSFSRPAVLLAFLGYPLTRRLQARFTRDSLRAMRAACGAAPSRVPAA